MRSSMYALGLRGAAGTAQRNGFTGAPSRGRPASVPAHDPLAHREVPATHGSWRLTSRSNRAGSSVAVLVPSDYRPIGV
jgi:hypothetical protein